MSTDPDPTAVPRTVHLRSEGVSLLLACDTAVAPLPWLVHWGADLGPLDEADARALTLAERPAVPNSALDEPGVVELLPQASRGHVGRGALSGHRDGRDWSPLFEQAEIDVEEAAIVVTARDEAAGLGLRTDLNLEEGGVLRMRHTLTNLSDASYDVGALVPQLPVPGRAAELLDLTGRWGLERVPQRHRLEHGAWVREGRHGRPGPDTPLLLVAGTPGFGFGHGEVWGVHVAWSGDTSWWAERLPEGPTAVGGGELLAAGEVRLATGESYATPWLHAVHATDGLDGLSRRLHRWVRARPQHPSTPRKVLLNTWEAVYFDHDVDRLRTLADQAAAIGVERFVLDDGWFGSRRDDRRGLGDWEVSGEAWPDGLTPLIGHVTGLGMDFGIWVEPEMVNLDSDVVRAHPDWVLAPEGRTPPSWRHQQVLDLANPDAWAHVLGRLDALLRDHDVAFVKWDHNRDLIDADHSGGPGVRRQVLAFYALVDELRRRHPGVEVESCASGGSRVDLEVLARTDRIWTSDCTDAHDRQLIQRWTGLLVPPELMGAHVSAPENHQTGRRLDLSFRAGTALFGHFGIEWDVSSATDEERAELARWVAAYRRLRPLLHGGDQVRADDLPDGLELHGVVAPDRDDALFALVSTGAMVAAVPPRLCLPGLDPDRSYRVAPEEPGHEPRTVHGRGPAWLGAGGVVLPGSALAVAGLAVPLLAPDQLLLLRVSAV